MKRISFNNDWHFTRLASGKTERVDLPHDATISEPRDPAIRIGYLCAFYHGGKYEYRKSFTLPREWAEKAVYLEFEGIYCRSEVFVNGSRISSLTNGYIGVSERIDHLLHAGENEVRVTVDTPYNDHSRWYQGSGIYRDVWLYVGEKEHIPPHALKVRTLSHAPAVIEANCRAEGELSYTVFDGATPVAHGKGSSARIEIPRAKLWSDETPHLYTLKAELYSGGVKRDEAEVKFGIRTLSWSAEEGFLVNGKRTLLRGGCIHCDNGVLGCVTTRQTELRRAQKIKSCGFNAVRSAHHPMSPALLEACDEAGLFVMDEAFDMWYRMKTRNDFSSAFYEEFPLILREMAAKDYNHPCVVLYSIGNEIPEIGSKKAIRFGKEMIGILREEDGTRPVLMCPSMRLAKDFLFNMPYHEVDEDEWLKDPVHQKEDFQHYVAVWTRGLKNVLSVFTYDEERKEQDERATKELYDLLDLAGYNYYGEYYEDLHKLHPERVIVGTETEGNKLSYHFEKMKKYPYVIGDFVWTLQDHLGECNCADLRYGDEPAEKDFPWVTNWCGKLDLIGDENITAHRYRMVWGLEKGICLAAQPPVHGGAEAKFSGDRETDAVMNWTFEGCEGNRTYIDAVTDAPFAEVLINGRSLGVQKTQDFRTRFFCSFEPGEVIGRGSDEKGNLLYETSMKTAGKGTKLTLSPDRKTLRADGQEMCFVYVSITDEAGALKALPERLLKAKAEGAASLAGFGSAAYKSEHGFWEGIYETFGGRALAVLRAGTKPGKAVLTVEGEGLFETLEIEVRA